MKLKKFKQFFSMFTTHQYMKEKTELFQAVEDNNIEKVKTLLETLPEKEINLIYNAELINSHDTMVPLNTAFSLACYQGKNDIIELFLNSPKVDFSYEDSLKNTVLFDATKLSSIETLRKMINSGKFDIHHKNKHNQNIMNYLAGKMYHANSHSEDTVQLFKELVEKEVDFHLRDKINDKNNVFDLAIESRQPELVKYLLTTDIEKSDINHPEPAQIYHAMWADMYNDTKIAIALIDHGFDYTDLHEVIADSMSDFSASQQMDEFKKSSQKLFDYIHIKKEHEALSTLIKEPIYQEQSNISIESPLANIGDKIKASRNQTTDEAKVEVPTKRRDKI